MTMYETQHEQEHPLVGVDPTLAVSMMLAEAEMLRLETEIALAMAALRPFEVDESVIHDLSPLGR